MRLAHLALALTASVAAGCIQAPSAIAQTAFAFVLLGEGADGAAVPMVRTVAEGASACPQLQPATGAAQPMTERQRPAVGFDQILVCEARYPRGTDASVVVNGQRIDLPVVTLATPRRVILLGDSGCEAGDKQDCGDAKAWPYVIRSSAAALDGQSGRFTAVMPPLERTSRPSTRHPRWWTDDPDPATAEGVHAGATSVSRWREDRTCDQWGQFFYIKDLRRGAVWSAGAASTAEQTSTIPATGPWSDRSQNPRRLPSAGDAADDDAAAVAEVRTGRREALGGRQIGRFDDEKAPRL